MEGLPNFEQREGELDLLILELAEKEGMTQEDIWSDMATFASMYEEGDETVLPYFEEVAEKIDISSEEMIQYALKKAMDYKQEEEGG